MPRLGRGALRRPVLADHARLRWDALRVQHQLVFPEGVLALNWSAAVVLSVCDGREWDRIIAALAAIWDRVEEAEIDRFLTRLASRGLVRDAEKPLGDRR